MTNKKKKTPPQDRSPESYRAFWSYVHKDDESEGGRISQLSRLVSDRASLLTGTDFPIFLDHDGIGWGQKWRMTIEEALERTMFFIPVITPRYFKSEICRAELIKFLASAENLGLRELILPIYYVEVPQFVSNESSDDELIELVKSLQYEDWRETALDDIGYSLHRKAVHRLAQALKDRSEEADRKPAGANSTVGENHGADPVSIGGQQASSMSRSDKGEVEGLDEQPGAIDILADGEEAIRSLQATVEAIQAPLENLTTLAQESTDKIVQSDRNGKGFAGRLTVARSFSKGIEQPAAKINAIAQDFLRDLMRVDPMVRLMSEQVVSLESPIGQDVHDFFASVHEMAAVSEASLGQLDGLADSINESASWSKDIRRASRPLIAGLRQLADARSVFNSWLPLVDEILNREVGPGPES